MVKGLHHLPYIQRLLCLNLCSFEKRRRRADLFLAYGIFHGRYDLPQELFFSLPSCSHLHGQDLKLRHRSFNLARRKAALSVRIVEPWNKLPWYHPLSLIRLQCWSSRTDLMLVGRPSSVRMNLNNCLTFFTWFSAICAFMANIF